MCHLTPGSLQGQRHRLCRELSGIVRMQCARIDSEGVLSHPSCSQICGILKRVISPLTVRVHTACYWREAQVVCRKGGHFGGVILTSLTLLSPGFSLCSDLPGSFWADSLSSHWWKGCARPEVSLKKGRWGSGGCRGSPPERFSP